MVHHQRDVVLELRVRLYRAEEVTEETLRVLEVVRREAPHIHRYGRILIEDHLLTMLIGEGDLTLLITSNSRTLHDPGEEAVSIYLTDTTCYTATLAEGIPYTIADHAVLVMRIREATKLVC